MSIKFDIKYDDSNWTDDRGINDRYPSGTVSNIVCLDSSETGTKLFIKIYFMPSGGREFMFIGMNNLTDTFPSQKIMPRSDMAPKVCFNSTEIQMIHVALKWISDNKNVIYPPSHR